MSDTLKGRVALVTGGSRGVGRAISLAMAADGADVAVIFRKDQDAADAIVSEITAMGQRAIACQSSVTDYDAIRDAVTRVETELGPIGILVNNAGIASRGKTVADTDPEELLRVVSTHALASHFLSGLVIPKMRELDRGDIVMISSAATQGLGANGAPYNMAKCALEALAFTLAKEEMANGIRVNIAAPGLVETEMGSRLVKATQGVDDLRTIDANMPFGHVCQPEEVANVVHFFVSAKNTYVTGERLYIHGGGARW